MKLHSGEFSSYNLREGGVKVHVCAIDWLSYDPASRVQVTPIACPPLD